MSPRLKLIVAYDGEPFAGWQSQANGNAVQDHLERAFKRIGGAALRVHGAGRTDAGVHALAQCAHVDLANDRIPLDRWLPALNAVLPSTIRVLRCRRASRDFHARFAAKGKVYRYRIWSAAVLPPLEYGRAWHITGPLDFKAMKAAAAGFVGTHDFAAFAANRAKKNTNTIRTIRSILVRRSGRCITLEIDGDGFLYKMVRLIVGALVQHATGKSDLPAFGVRPPSRRTDRSRLVAPAAGLFLIRVRY
jgi:tRNA pseudouridine38-40 synthase